MNNTVKTKQPLGFFKTLLASTLGMLVAGIILVFLFVVMITASIASQFDDFDKKPSIKESSVLHLTLSREIVDNGPQREFQFNFDGMEDNGREGLNQLVESIEHAKTDKNIKGIFLDLGYVQAGAATVEALRKALLDFKTSKKFIIAYGEVYNQKAYYLATTADKIYLFPTGLIQHTGLYSELMFFKGLIDKLDLDVSIIRGSGNKFKSAVEPFMYEQMSDANRVQLTRIQEVVWNQMLKGISGTRGISIDELQRLADSAIIRNPESAVAYKMVDKLLYRDEVIDILHEKTGIEKDKKLRLVKVGRYYESFSENGSTNELVKLTRKKNDKIAVIYASGEIVDGKGSNQVIGSVTLAQQLRAARLDKKVKAIVLRIDSPGGSALASEVIWRETQLAKKAKPFIVSMGDLAASGGYYIACGAHRIYAEPTTITGSIGVFGILPHTERFFKTNTGITFDRVKTNRYSDIGSTTRKMDDTEYKIIQSGVDEIYDKFTLRVSQGRNLNHQLVKDSIGEGRVWMGTDALALGLVDEMGGLNEAIAEAVKRAKIKKYIIQNYPEEKDPFRELIEKLKNPEEDEDENGESESMHTLAGLQQDVLYTQFKKIIGKDRIDAYLQVLNMLEHKSVRAQLPFFMVER